MGRVTAPVTVVIALGSNLGDRRAHLGRAVEKLAEVITDLRVSSIIETEPVDVPDAQPPYLNAVAVGETTIGAADLLKTLLEIERGEGRRRPSRRAPRTLDLDLILYGDLVLKGPALTVPHPRFRERRFVLEPLAELAPEMIDPQTGRRAADLLAALTRD